MNWKIIYQIIILLVELKNKELWEKQHRGRSVVVVLKLMNL